MHNFVCHGHKRVLHFVFHLGDEPDYVQEQELKQLLPDISFISTEFAFDILDERFRVRWLTVIHIAGSEHKIKNLPSLN